MPKLREDRRVRGILLDIDGVVTVGGAALPGSLEAIQRLRELQIPFRLITNTTRRPRSRIVSGLAAIGLSIAAGDVFTPAIVARDYLAQRHLTPLLIVHPDLLEDFAGLKKGRSEAVVVGDAADFFTYRLLNQAYRKIIHGAEFLALAKNRNFLDHDGELSLDAGPFVTGLEYASGKGALVLGKPAPAFFHLAVQSLPCDAADAVMIGDDAEADIGGAMAAGLQGILVRTGKYRPGQEAKLPLAPAFVAENLKSAVEQLFG
jgi:HAD superfamily hydrolase (TIGR01458 family)